MERATKAVKAGGFERARIVMDLERKRIEVIIGDMKAESDGPNPFDED